MNYNKTSFKRIIPHELFLIILFLVLAFILSFFLELNSFYYRTSLFIFFIIISFVGIFYLPALYKNSGWFFDGNVLHTKAGCLFFKKSSISADKIINVSLLESPFTPILKTVSVIIRIPGANFLIRGMNLNDGENLVDEIMQILSLDAEV